MPCVTANAGEVDLNVYADVYWINLSPSCIGRSESTRFQLRFSMHHSGMSRWFHGQLYQLYLLSVRVLQQEPKDFSPF